MDPKPRTPEETYGPALTKARLAFPGLEPHQTAVRAGVSFHEQGSGSGQFQVPYLGKIYQVDWPAGTVRLSGNPHEADIATRILLLHYLLTADGTPLATLCEQGDFEPLGDLGTARELRRLLAKIAVPPTAGT